ncbi:MAG: putative metal-binding motif-containing protein, partial [Myxococcota bacterium]|nr:putative metal-binding motif-containing protein [Myxococcota bacterium]
LGEGDGCDDLDGDGYGLGVDCVDADCNDNDGSVHVGAVDVCDNKDQDCDGNFDEDFEATSCGIGACASTSTCTEGVEFSCQPGDALNEEDATCDGVDDDCDERVDEGYVPEGCGNGPCVAESSCVDGAVQDCIPHPAPSGVDSTCDGVDDDCDGAIDDDFAPGRCGEGVCAADEVCVEGEMSCTPGAPLAEDDTNCNGIDEDCEGGPDDDYSSDATCGVGACVAGFQCIDGSSACVELMPLSELDETCDGIDDNCNGLVDEDCGRNYLRYRLKAEETTSEVMAVEVYYEQETSPSPDAINPLLLQPEAIELQLVMNSMQMLPQSENFVTLSEPVVSAGKLLEWFQFENEAGVQIDGNYLVRIVRPNAGPGANSRIPPGSLLTLYFERVAPAGPYSLEWGPFPEGRTSFLPLNPSGRALVPETSELNP